MFDATPFNYDDNKTTTTTQGRPITYLGSDSSISHPSKMYFKVLVFLIHHHRCLLYQKYSKCSSKSFQSI